MSNGIMYSGKGVDYELASKVAGMVTDSSAPKPVKKPSLFLRLKLWFRRLFKSKPRAAKHQWSFKLIRIVKLTPVKRHAWVESTAGLVRKELGQIPQALLNDYFRAQGA